MCSPTDTPNPIHHLELHSHPTRCNKKKKNHPAKKGDGVREREEWHFNTVLEFKIFYLHLPSRFLRLYKHHSKGEGFHSTSSKVQFTGKLVNGKIKAKKRRSQLPISDFSILILFPPSLNVRDLSTERDHQDRVGTLAERTVVSPGPRKEPLRMLFVIPTIGLAPLG